ncbi:DUF2500 domain-containing protein [Paenibacillus sp. KQZ6P-2]|uniref:DUF2500 domain-containing protein n=1 Tax=Paenibacillus mangrovi TaxID=2931978 RepID=A0A9X1WRV3_9BACL|nr:DUF2500 domain-containing protein [Paenibacillus mangrovi]MCJ8014212.1 DUF2500 domain-containing protein [Paenibacillus mangrovi]
MDNFGGPPSFFAFLLEVPPFFLTYKGLILIFVICVFAYVIIKVLSTWISNNASEITQKRCKVTDKRTQVWGGSNDISTSTNYYITFEFEDNTRKELYVGDKHYGLISIGDQGELTYQGTRFKGFIRMTDNQ